MAKKKRHDLLWFGRTSEQRPGLENRKRVSRRQGKGTELEKLLRDTTEAKELVSPNLR